jgi:hypothetical protein
MNRWILVLLLAVLIPVIVQSVSADSSMIAAIGDLVPLRGTAPGTESVYLFLTGPNLPSNGVRLEDVSSPVISGDPGTFTRASVSRDQWEYNWYTNAGGRLDAGTYTVYVVTTPVGRGDLDGAVYSTISVTLTTPVLIVAPTGSIIVRSIPPGAEVQVDGVLQGTTPVELTGVPEGVHQVEVQLPGYAPFFRTVTVTAGEAAEVDVALAPVTSSQTTVFTTSVTSLPGTSVPIPSPTTAGWPVAISPLCLAATVMWFHHRRSSR